STNNYFKAVFQQNFVSIHGIIYDNNNAPIPNFCCVSVTGSAGFLLQADPNGVYGYDFFGPCGNSTPTPHNSNYTWSPPSTSFTNLQSNKTNVNFVGTPVQTFVIMGTIVDNNNQPMQNVTVNRTGSATPTTTGPDGKFSFPQLAPGPYTITPLFN